MVDVQRAPDAGAQYEEPEEEEDGLIRYQTIPFDDLRHRAELERLVIRSGVVAMILLIVGAFIVLMWGPTSAKTSLTPVMTALAGLILGALGVGLRKGQRRPPKGDT